MGGMLGRECDPPQPRLLSTDIVCETQHIARGSPQHVGYVLAFSPTASNLSSKRIGCYRRPDGFSSSLYELATSHLDLRRALTELVRDDLNI
ncbi:MAG TPA: hypothetical protein VK662_08845 [Acidothermaceae bacterium]|nr:hypothetical protein [Acidothermaceae bacterium]